MGASSWSSHDWATYSSHTATKSAREIFTKTKVSVDMSPKGTRRECRDSDVNPETTPIIVALDVTGSMGHISYQMAQKGLGTLVENVLDRKPVVGPQIMFMAHQDADYNGEQSFQIGQFEADITMTKWLEGMVHGGGGGNDIESYDLAYYYAAYKISTDAMEKRGKKGYIFSIGDECAPLKCQARHVEALIGDSMEKDILFSDLVAVVRQSFIPYHIIVREGSFASGHYSQVKASWDMVLGQNVLTLDDHRNVAELIVSILQIENGADKDVVAASWSGSTAVAIRDATSHLPTKPAADGSGVVHF